MIKNINVQENNDTSNQIKSINDEQDKVFNNISNNDRNNQNTEYIKKKKLINYFCIAIAVFSIVLCGLFYTYKKPITATNIYDIAKEGYDIESESRFMKSTVDELEKIISDGEDAVFYFSFPDCPWCLDATPVLNEVLHQNNMYAYYINTRDYDKSGDNYKRMASLISSTLKDNPDTVYVPEVIVIKKGQIIDYHISTVEGYTAGVEEMNSKQIKELQKIYTKMLKKL